MTQWIVSSSILILIVIGLRFLLRKRIKPILQYALWALVLVRLLVPLQLGSTPISLENAVEKAPVVQQMELADRVVHFVYHADGTATGYYEYQPPLDHTAQTPVSKPVPQTFTQHEAQSITRIRDVKGLLQKIWLGGMAVFGLIFLLSNLRFALGLRKSRKPEKEGRLPVYITDKVETPCLFGLLRPAIYLPPAVAEEPRHRDYSVAHETTHFRHGDALWSVLRCVCIVLHWYNPLVWWAAVLSREDGEIACDEATITALGEELRSDYGRVLVDLTCRKRTDLLQTATTMTGSAKGLKQRISMIVKRPKMAIYALICLILAASIAIGCTFTGGKKPAKQTGDDPVETTESTESTKPSENTESTKPTQNTTKPNATEKLPDTIPGTPLTPDELTYFTELFSDLRNENDEINWYNILLCCPFDRPQDIDLRALFQNGFSPNVELTKADETFLTTQAGYELHAGDINKLPADRVEQVLNTYLGVSLTEVNRHYLESMDYFADSDCYFTGGGGAIGAVKFAMIDGKQTEDGTVYLLCRDTESRYNPDWLRILCLKPQAGNDTAPYQVQSCQWLTYFGSPYPWETNPDDYVPYMYTGKPVFINGNEVKGHHMENYLYLYNLKDGTHSQLVYAPIHSFTTDQKGYVYFVVQDQSQIIRSPYPDLYPQRMQIMYTSNKKINSVTYTEDGKLLVDEGGVNISFDLTPGGLLHLPSTPNGIVSTGIYKYFVYHNRPDSEVMDFGYNGKPYTLKDLAENGLYAVDDGQVYTISNQTVSEWEWDQFNDYLYFVRQSDPRKIWRTDLHGQNPTVIYESQYGDINFLSYYRDQDSHDWLLLVENSNRYAFFDMTAKKMTIMPQVYYMEQFSYDAGQMRIFWKGQLNKNDPEMPLGGYTYYYYPKTNQYQVLKGNNTWVTVTPES